MSTSASTDTGRRRRRRRHHRSPAASAIILATALLLLLLALCACPSTAGADARNDVCAEDDGTCASANSANTNASAEHDVDENGGNNDAAEGESYVNQRIAAKYDDGRIYRGTITGYTPAADATADNGLWHIVYDDGDEGEIGGYGHLRATLELFDSLQAEAGAGIPDPSTSDTEPKQKKTHSKMTGKKKGVPPEECTSWVAADITRCLVAESRPRMLLHCAEACRDVAGVTAEELTSEQRLEDAARGFLYYFQRGEREEKKYGSAADEEAEAEGPPCTDHDDRCAEWIYDHDGCLHNADFMAETCPKSCHFCFPAGEVTVITFGVEQLTDYHGNDVANAATADVIERTAEYMLDHVMVEDKYEDVRRDCYNFDTKCS